MNYFDKDFENTCKEKFDFLIYKYSFKYIGFKRINNILMLCNFRKNDLEICAYFDLRELRVSVCMEKLENLRCNAIYDVDWFLIKHKPDRKIDHNVTDNMLESLRKILWQYRNILLKYGNDVLNGNVEFIEKIKKEIINDKEKHPELYFPPAEGETIEDVRARLKKGKEILAKIKKGNLEDLK